jgi:hypothetical protein
MTRPATTPPRCKSAAENPLNVPLGDGQVRDDDLAPTSGRRRSHRWLSDATRRPPAGAARAWPAGVGERRPRPVREERWGFGLAPHHGQPNDPGVVNDDQLDRAAVDSQPPPWDPTPNQRERPVRRRGQFGRAGSSPGVFDHAPGTLPDDVDGVRSNRRCRPVDQAGVGSLHGRIGARAGVQGVGCRGRRPPTR